MKDLYWRNGLRPRETDRVKIHEAAGLEEDRGAAFAILLNAAKKAQYDSAHLALNRVGYLRRHMGLAGRANWRLHYGDFLEPAKDDLASHSRAAKPRHKARIIGWCLILLLVLALLLPLAYLLASIWENAQLPPL